MKLNIRRFLGVLFGLVCVLSISHAKPILVTDDGRNRVAVFEDNELLWELPATKTYDARLLPDKTVLVTYHHGVKKVTLDKRVLFDFKQKGEVFSSVPLKNGHFLVANCSEHKLIEIDGQGKQVREIVLDAAGGHGGMRHIRMTPKGTVLVGHLGQHLLREYDLNGKILFEYKAPAHVYAGHRLDTGNTLVAWQQGVQEVNRAGKVVWELKSEELPEIGIKWLNALELGGNGNVVIGNWLGHGHHGQGVPFFELTRDKKVVWKFIDAKAVKQATSIQVLNEEQLGWFKAQKQAEMAKYKREDFICWDFEDGTAQGWEQVDGNLNKLVSGPNVFKNISGTKIINTLYNGGKRGNDRFTTQIESPVFTLNDAEVSFMIAGGGHKKTRIALCNLAGKELQRAYGKYNVNVRKVKWDCSKWVGQKVYFKMVDSHKGGWGCLVGDRFEVFGKIDLDETKFRRELAKLEKRKEKVRKLNFAAVSLLINDLKIKFPDKFSATQFENKVAKFQKQIDDLDKTLKSEPYFVQQLKDFKREVVLANPLLTESPIAFVVRKQYKRDHHNTATLFQNEEINTNKFDPPGLIKKIDFSKGGEVSTIVDGGKTALARDPEIHFSGKKMVFSMRKSIEDEYHIYEVNVDGTGLKQLTRAKRVADIDPLYLPDDSIVFTSTREPKYCMCNRHIMGNMFKMDADGANIHQIGKSTLFEGHSALMPDGRIIYDRWEYVDRNFGDAQGLWTVNPDGTQHLIYYGNNTASPGGVIDARPIPGTNKVICILGSCHDRPWGALAILDRTKGVDGKEPILRTWPAESRNWVSEKGTGKWDIFMRLRTKYEDPFPLDKDYFLVSKMIGEGEKTGIYIVDTFGNETLLHTEGPGCYDPMPIRPSKRPPVRPSARNFTDVTGKFYVQDVYYGTHMKGVKRGSVKYLRVVEAPEKRSWTNEMWSGQGTIAPGMNWHDFSNKKILGTVPVEDDGSAFFEVPSDTFLFFQLLDKDGKMVQSMRSGTIVQPGETQGCIGCHDDRTKNLPVNRSQVKALQRPASKLDGWLGEPRLFNYLSEIQPVWDKNCVSCHDYGKKAGEKLLLCGDKTLGFNTSYNELWRKRMVGGVGGGPSQIQPAYSWGAHASKLAKVLEKGHQKVELSEENWERVYSWLNINAPYYPTYDSAYPKNMSGRSPLSHKDLNRLSQLIGLNLRRTNSHHGNRGPQLSFDRPELSRCLQKLKKGSPKYKEALSIIQKGKENLAKTPRADMSGFVPGEYAQKRLKFYDFREKVEAKNRKAIAEGRKVYDQVEAE